MIKRGKILRDTNSGPGLLSIEGQQYPFTLEGNWKSDVVPAVNMVVEVEFSDDNCLLAVRAVAEGQLAKEQAEIALKAAKGKASDIGAGLVARFGIKTLIAMAALIVGWFFLNTLHIQLSSYLAVKLSFWQLIAVLDYADSNIFDALSSRPSHIGLFGYVTLFAAVGPLLPYFIKDHRAHLGGLLPLGLMLIVLVAIATDIIGALRQMHEIEGLVKNVMSAVSIGSGLFLSFAASLYFAGRSAIKFLASRA